MMRYLLGASAAAMVATGATAAPITIDDFENGAFSQGTATTAIVLSGTAIGGFRAVAVGGGFGQMDLVLSPGDDGVLITGGSVATSAKDFAWGVLGLAAFRLNTDLTDGGTNDRFELSFSASTVPYSGYTLESTVWTVDGAGVVTGMSTITGGLIDAGGNAQLDFASFTGGADFTDIDRINLIIRGPSNGETILFNDFIATGDEVDGPPAADVPAPAALGLLGLGLAGLGLRRRARRA
ncbi:MAG: PEP-CTERM sorting domain-containing protein [Pacificimonas sp.]|jgi:hypothetical protein|nr:PEP-CTERM sorting domain-containing protein [Pacificimonas sp.]